MANSSILPRGSIDTDLQIDSLQTLIRSLARFETSPALVTFHHKKNRVWSFRELIDKAQRLATGLAAAGLQRGAYGLLCAPSSSEWIITCFALIEAGAIPVPVDTQVGEEEFRHICQDSEARWVFTATSMADRLATMIPDHDCRLVLLDGEEKDKRSLEWHVAEQVDRFPSVDSNDPAVLFYTSGTTGLPKGVPLTHRNLVSNLFALLRQRLLVDKDRLLLPLPVHHAYPFTVGLLTPLSSGVPVVLPYSLVGPQILRALTDGEATIVVAVPRFYQALIATVEARVRRMGRLAWGLFSGVLRLSIVLRRHFHIRIGPRLFAVLHRRFAPRLRMVVSGGAALDRNVAWKLEGLGWEVASGYGLTETSPILTINVPGTLRFGSAGMPLPSVEVRIADPDRRSRQGEGEVQVKGPNVFAAYRNLPEKTKEAFTQDGYFRTGDFGWFKDGVLYLSGRVSSRIVLPGGENINPEYVEGVLQQSKAVREAGVLEDRHRLVALVVPAASTERLEKSELEKLIRQEIQQRSASLPSHHRIGDYAITMEPLPRTRLGKIRRHKLQDLYIQAKRRGPVLQKGPMPVEQMASEDRQLLELDEARAVWDWLLRRFPDARLTPDTHLHLDLSVDSLEWLSLTSELREQTGLELSDEAIGRVETVRDVLREAIEARTTDGSSEDVLGRLRRPLELLDEKQRRWLAPQGSAIQEVGTMLLSLTRHVMTTRFGITVQGVNHLPPHGPLVMVTNHMSLLDPLALVAALPEPILGRTYWAGWTGVMFRNRFVRLVSRATRVVPIEQGGRALISLAYGAAILDKGHPLVWFAEGGRSPDGQLKPFQPGIGFLLQARPVPAVPVWIGGGYEALPMGAWWPHFYPMTVRFGSPLLPSELERQGRGTRPHECITDALNKQVAALGSDSDRPPSPD
jgi:long-chain acyl-CoA synthetase